MVEQGTHESLLADPDGVYNNLVTAQHLEVASAEDREDAENDDGLEKVPTAPEDLQLETASEEDESKEPEFKPKGFVASVGFLLYEQHHLYHLYILVLIGAMVAAGKLVLLDCCQF